MLARRRRGQTEPPVVPERPWMERANDHDVRVREHGEEGRVLDGRIAQARMELYRLEQERNRHLARSGDLARQGRALQGDWNREHANELADDFREPDMEARKRGRERYGCEHEEIVLRGIEASGDPAAPDMEAGRLRWEEERYGASADHPPEPDYPERAPLEWREPFGKSPGEPRESHAAPAREEDGGRGEEAPEAGAGGPSSRRRVGPTRGRPGRGRPGGSRTDRGDDDRGMEP